MNRIDVIETNVKALADAMDKRDEQLVGRIALRIVGDFLKDVSRIADAMEQANEPEKHRQVSPGVYRGG